MRTAKLYGLQRSGTNYLQWLLEKNYRLELWGADTAGSKHSLSCLRAFSVTPDCVVLSVKDPFAWLVSLWGHTRKHASRKRYKAPAEFTDFLRGPIVLPQPEGKVYHDNPVALWNNYNRHWLSIQDTTVVSVRYEDILGAEAAEKHLNVLAHAQGWPRDSAEFICPRNRMAGGQAISRRGFNPLYYVNRKYLDEYTPKDIDYVAALLHAPLMERLGYDSDSARA